MHLSINNLALWYGNQAHNHCQTAKLFLDKYYVALGLCLGLVFGVAMDSIPIGLCLGIGIGAALQRRHQADAM